MTTTEVLQFGEAYPNGQCHEAFYVSFYVMNQLPDNRFVAGDDHTREIRCTGSSLSHPDPHGSTLILVGWVWHGPRRGK
jgi:hypothetical protein